MTAKEFLRQARDADRRIDEAMERLERMRAKLEAGRMSNLTGMPRGGAVDWTETADRVIELERRVNSRIREMVRQKQAAMDAIPVEWLEEHDSEGNEYGRRYITVVEALSMWQKEQEAR